MYSRLLQSRDFGAPLALISNYRYPMGPGAQEIGHRLTIRLNEPEGGFKDIMGILESETTLRKKDGSLVQFQPSEVAIWRKITPPKERAGHGAPLSLRIRDMETAANATWPAKEIQQIGHWLLRASGKFTMRANSVLPLGTPPYGDPGMEIHEAISVVTDFYKQHKLPAIFHIPLPTYFPLDDLLHEAGWIEKITAQVMVGDIGPVNISTNPLGTWEFADSPTDEWLSVQSDHEVAEIMKSAPATYAALRVEGEMVAVGRGAPYEKWSVLSRLYVKPDYRRQGIAQELIYALLAVAKNQGATKSLLQVDEKNHSAIDLYTKIGFFHHHSYTYRVLAED